MSKKPRVYNGEKIDSSVNGVEENKGKKTPMR